MGIKWFFALNDAGGNFANYALMSKVAVLSARRHTQLEPHFLFDGAPCELTRWMEQHGVRVIRHRTSVYERLRQHAQETGRKNTLTTGAGAFLRLDIPDVCAHHGIDDRYVLYTDCDVLFRRDVAPDLLPLEPAFFAAAPQFHQHDPSDMNSGVLWMNLDGLRPLQERFREFIRENLDTLRLTGFDQAALRAFYGHRRWGGPAWDALPLALNWKPHWGMNADAAILHFHGPKPTQRTQLARGTAPPTLVRMAGPDYYACCRQWDEVARDLGGDTLSTTSPPRIPALPAVIAGFDEAAYAVANIDVALAVRAGHYGNGLEHYLTAGYWEGRAGVAPGASEQVRARLGAGVIPPVAPPYAARIAGRVLAVLMTAEPAAQAGPRFPRGRTLVLGSAEVAGFLESLGALEVTAAPAPWAGNSGGSPGGTRPPVRIPFAASSFERVVLVLPASEWSRPASTEWMREVARVTRRNGTVAAWLSLREGPAGHTEAPARMARPRTPVPRDRWFEVLGWHPGVGGDRACLVTLRRRVPLRRKATPAAADAK
ncbi:MAG: hypothetical protein ACT4P0_13690 [Panacagrimonas sp.]